MVTLTDAIYGATTSISGVYSTVTGPAFTGASLGLGALGPVALTGAFTTVGQTINATFGGSSTIYQVTYEGYYLVNGQPVYIFKPPSSLGLSAFGVHAEPSQITVSALVPLVTTTPPIDPSTPCFLAGTMIATPEGEKAVEDLRPGDLVHVFESGQVIVRPVTWTGGRSMSTPDFADRSEAFPVRIRQHAFAANIPHRDLLVTPEHCILTEAGLIPARMLVNGATILIDRNITEYEFFHIELENHGILLSEGLTTESYLDTGNRGLFADADAGMGMCNERVMAAPLAVSRELVEPIWNQLVQRARELGFEALHATAVLTDEPDLRLLLDDGTELPTCWHSDMRHMFQIPRGATPVRLLSRTAVPAEMIGPFVDDRRTLGVAIDRLVLWNGLNERVMPAADLDLAGWHQNEGGCRWTDGNASLDLPRAGGETFLDIHLAATLLYREAGQVAA